jgi:hypothetical protein
VELSPEAVRQLYVDHEWSLTKIGNLVGRSPVWTADVLERQGVKRRPAHRIPRKIPTKPPAEQPAPPEMMSPETRLTPEDMEYAAARLAAGKLPSIPYEGDPGVALHLLINKVAPFQPKMQAALRVIFGLVDGKRWPSLARCGVGWSAGSRCADCGATSYERP